MRKWLTTQQVAEDLGCHVQTVRALIRSGRLIARQFVARGKDKRPRMRIEPVELERYKLGTPTTEKAPRAPVRRRRRIDDDEVAEADEYV